MKIKINDKIFNVEIANTFFKKLIGLMGKKKIEKGMIFINVNSIHTFFMKENIDIIMLNKNKQVLYAKKNVQKNKIIIKKEAYYTIELPKNSLTNIDRINIEFPKQPSL